MFLVVLASACVPEPYHCHQRASTADIVVGLAALTVATIDTVVRNQAESPPPESPPPPPKPRPLPEVAIVGQIWTVSDGQTRPVPSVTLRLVEYGHTVDLTTADERGNFAFARRVPWGAYRVEIADQDYAGSAPVGGKHWPPTHTLVFAESRPRADVGHSTD